MKFNKVNKMLTKSKHGGGGSLDKTGASSKRKCIISGITGIMVGVILTGGITVAAVTLTANQIKYTPSNEKFTATNAEEALDEIYKIAEYEIPADTYFYDSETEGEDIVRYKKVDGKYYLCDKNGKITDENEQDISSLTLIEYTSTTEENLSVGNAGYASGKFYLGSNLSSDSENSKEIIYLGNGTSFDLTSYDGYENFTVDNFILEPVTTALAKVTGSFDHDARVNSIGLTLTKTYSNGKLDAKITVPVRISNNVDAPLNISRNFSVKAYLVY